MNTYLSLWVNIITTQTAKKIFYNKTKNKGTNMSLDEIREELEISGVEMEHVSKLIRICKRFGFNAKEMDERLLKWGYNKVFTIYDE